MSDLPKVEACAGTSEQVHHSLNFGKAPVRVLLAPDGLWFPAADIFAANSRRTDRDCLARFAPEHLRIETFPSDAGPVRLTAVSPLGAVTIAADLPPPKDRIFDAWVRREANLLADAHGFPRLELTLLATGMLPVKPRAAHDSYQQWKDLQRRNPVVYRLEWDPYMPALFDDDPSLPPHDPTGNTKAFQDMLEAGRAAIEASPKLQALCAAPYRPGARE